MSKKKKKPKKLKLKDVAELMIGIGTLATGLANIYIALKQ